MTVATEGSIRWLVRRGSLMCQAQHNDLSNWQPSRSRTTKTVGGTEVEYAVVVIEVDERCPVATRGAG